VRARINYIRALSASKPSTSMSLGLDWWSPCDGRSVHWHPSRWGYFFHWV